MASAAAIRERPCPICLTENPNPPPGRYGRDGWSAVAWEGVRFPDHVNCFDRNSLRRLAEDAGFVVKMPAMQSLPTDDDMPAILVKPSPPESRRP